jgi:putative transposase
VSLARSTYYYQPKTGPEETSDGTLRQRIDEICGEFSGYGYRRVTQQLKDEGWGVNKKRIQRLMRQMGLQRRPKKRWIITTDSDHDFAVYPNRLAGWKPMGINQAWVSDITYIRLAVGFVYLAVILDLFSRKVIGWAISRNIDTQLTLAALEMAMTERKPVPGCIHHSDRGVQYAATDYVKTLMGAGMLISMSAKGNPYDNAVAESFMKTIKTEEVYLGDYRTLEDVLAGVPRFIEAVYNRKRLHSSLGYKNPTAFEAQLLNPTSGTSQQAA